MATAIGIDLGTSNSCVAIARRGRIEVLENSYGEPISASVVHFGDGGVSLVGNQAKALAVQHPEHTIAAAKVAHPNVIRIYDFLHIRGNYAISMEYFASHTLGAEVADGKPMALRRAIRFGMDIARGMAVAHVAGIVHRDLKPANVLIDNEGLLKIVDFGVAAAQHQGDTQLTKTGYVIGSPKYMAPEQILGKKVDERADIYSLGIMLYEMLTGTPPYHRGDHMSVMYQHVQGRARPPIELNPALPQALSDLVMKAIAVDKEKRFASMDELHMALERFL